MHDTLRELLQRRPFKPFQLRLSNGESHTVRRPEQVMLLKTRFVLFWPKSERFIVCDSSEITDLQSVLTKKSKS